MKNPFFCVSLFLFIATIPLGCAEPDATDIPPVMSALNEMEALEKAGEEARLRDAVKQMSARAGDAERVDNGQSQSFDFPSTGTYVVDFETTVGNFAITVNREWSPRGAHHFHQLVEEGFYDGCGFFRVVPDFMVQFGLAADPEMTAKWYRNILDDPVKQSNKRGYVSFAKTGQPNSRSTQVFINFKSNAFLDSQGFSPFGEVTKGMDVVDKISSAHGEQPDQGKVRDYGNEYLKSQFPKLDYIKTARITTDDTVEQPQPESEDGATPETE